MQRVFPTLILFVFTFAARAAADAFEKWEPEIQKFEAADRAQMPPKGAILFVGSSSIRLWTNLVESFPKKNVIQRGFGGSTMADALATGNCTYIPDAMVYKVVMDPDAPRARGILYIDRKSRQPREVHGRVVVLCAQALESGQTEDS